MGVRILAGKADATSHAAAMYDSVSGWMIGPLWEAEDAEEQIESFLAWLGRGKHAVKAVALGVAPTGAVARDITDPRAWPDNALAEFIKLWRSFYVGGDGWLLDPLDCVCGHHHMAGDDGADEGCLSCPCGKWEPGNRVAAERLAEGEEVLVV